MKKDIFVLFVAMLAMVSCRNVERDLFSPNEAGGYEKSTYAEQFQKVWESMNEYYVFWTWTACDWDSVYEAQYTAFKERDNKGGRMPEDEFHERWESVLSGLIDHHMVVSLRNVRSDSVHVFDIAQMHLSERADYHEPLEAEPMQFALLDGDIAYFRASDLSSFNDSIPAYRDFVDAVKSAPAGVVLDLRSCSGDDREWLSALVGLFVSEPTTVFRMQTKSGPAPMSLTEPMPVQVQPVSGMSVPYRGKVVCLVDMHSRAMAEWVLWALSVLRVSGSDVTVLGEQTCGDMGWVPTGEKWPNTLYAGKFGDENILVHRKSTLFVSGTPYVCLGVDSRECMEGIGLKPDVLCPVTDELLLGLSDPMLEKALTLF